MVRLHSLLLDADAFRPMDRRRMDFVTLALSGASLR
jgi:hypothetical protein